MPTTKGILLADLREAIKAAQDNAAFVCGNSRVDTQLRCVEYFLRLAKDSADQALNIYQGAIE